MRYKIQMKVTLAKLATLSFLILTSQFVTAQPHSKTFEEQSFDGVWQTQGYGYIFEIKAPRVKIYETTSISCLESGLMPGRLIESDKVGFSTSITGFIDAFMEVRKTENSGEMHFLRSDTNTVMVTHNIGELPSLCTEENNATIADTAKVFINIYDFHYPFFELKNTSITEFSDSIKVKNTLTEKELYDSFVGVLAPLHDSHVIVSAPSIEEFFWGSGENQSPVSKGYREKLRTNLVDNYSIRLPIEYCNSQIQLTFLKENIAYLKVESFENYSENGNFEDDLLALELALDKVFESADQFNGLILDIRGNSGGSDKLGIALARRLTPEKYIAYFKQATIDFSKSGTWSPKQPSWVEPIARPSYFGEIVLLTDYDSISAAETFTMALMARKPSVIRIGSNTRGVFSDILPRVLPNGWLLGLPNERYLDELDVSYDETGISPHVKVSLDVDRMQLGFDNVLDLAVHHLNNTQ